MKTHKKGCIVLLTLFLCGNIVNVLAKGTHAASEKALTEQIASARPDNYAPLGVRGSPVHKAGEMMFSYRSIEMAMDGLQDENAIPIEETLDAYLMVPIKIRMRTHMFGAMFAPHDRITLMAMMSHRTNFIQMQGAHLHSPGGDGPRRTPSHHRRSVRDDRRTRGY